MTYTLPDDGDLNEHAYPAKVLARFELTEDMRMN